jgi:excisionase family DNA binding protein
MIDKMPDDSKSMLTPKQFAKRLSISVSQFWKMLSAGKIPAPVRLGERILRWSSEEVSKWIDAGCPNRDKWQTVKAR